MTDFSEEPTVDESSSEKLDKPAAVGRLLAGIWRAREGEDAYWHVTARR